jgi:hypothetical protein
MIFFGKNPTFFIIFLTTSDGPPATIARAVQVAARWILFIVVGLRGLLFGLVVGYNLGRSSEYTLHASPKDSSGKAQHIL